ncbi:MAG TPA: TonB-dependent receptor [Pseudomonas sp.]|nr:TonB-dependent receptor [Pseudomonas sp.]
MKRCIAWFMLLGCAGSASDVLAYQPSIDIKGTSLVELMNLNITSLSRKSEALNKAPAAVYVITNDEIKRMGVTHIAEALRYVPGVEVVRQEANKWAISIRGFNSRTANKLLVMIDGRSIYSPFFSGVLWEEKDVVLEDVERIEVIRGPGGTTWGANAVNGVINIITKDSRDTLGGQVKLGAGLEERSLGQARYGWRIDEQTTARVYGKFTERDDSGSGPTSRNFRDDGARMRRSGFRFDRDSPELGHLTLQGDLYEGDLGPHFHGLGSGNLGQENDGGNLKLDWSYSPTAARNHKLQLYYDDTTLELGGLSDRRHLWSFDYQLLQRWQNHELVGGVGYRRGSDNIDILTNPIVPITMLPEQRNEELLSAFIQDDMAFLEDRLHLILGSKNERNDYSKVEWQPSVRASYAFDEALIWAAWSKALRTPSRLEHDLAVAGQPIGDRLKPELASVYELGWRQQWSSRWQLDIATYWAEYEDLFTNEGTFRNQMQGEVKGIETSLSYQARSNWLLRLNYSHAEMDLSVSPGSQATTAPDTTEGNMPQDMLQLISLWDINPKWQLNTYLRYVDELPAQQQADSYWAGDISLVWRPLRQTQVQLVARHLGHAEHHEWGANAANAVEPDLAVYLTQEF